MQALRLPVRHCSAPFSLNAAECYNYRVWGIKQTGALVPGS